MKGMQEALSFLKKELPDLLEYKKKQEAVRVFDLVGDSKEVDINDLKARSMAYIIAVEIVNELLVVAMNKLR